MCLPRHFVLAKALCSGTGTNYSCCPHSEQELETMHMYVNVAKHYMETGTINAVTGIYILKPETRN
jgi:hypothetical protein